MSDREPKTFERYLLIDDIRNVKADTIARTARVGRDGGRHDAQN